jgi:hypothetical protein
LIELEMAAEEVRSYPANLKCMGTKYEF